VKHYINFYYQSWVLRNKLYHAPAKQLQVAKKWSERIREYAIKVGGEVKKFVERNTLKQKTTNVPYIRDQCKTVQYYIKNQKEIEVHDIRKYLNFKKRKRK